MLRIRDIATAVTANKQDIINSCAKKLKISPKDIVDIKIFKRSIDARKKNDIKYIYTVDVSVSANEAALIKKGGDKVSFAEYFSYDIPQVSSEKRPVVVGFGPAGMFAALVLAKAGLRPVVFERGDCVENRMKKVEDFFKNGKLDPLTNIQFGEGGAGTFSDGKLTTGTKNPRIAWVLEKFVEFGANEDILYDAKPHIGTDILVDVVKNLREEAVKNGATMRFCECIKDINTDKNGVIGVTSLKNGKEEHFECCDVVLAIGHSARDTFEMLHEKGIPMQPKAFSMGARIEHPQSLINESQYGPLFADKNLPPADYKLSCHLEDASVYTFCMCPGGYVVAAASEEGGVVTNGMSENARDAQNANSAVLVSVTPEDFPEKDALSGMRWQRSIEQKAFKSGGENYFAVAQKVGDLLCGKKSEKAGKVIPSYKPGVKFGDIGDVLPEKITEAIKKALPVFDKKIKGFAMPDAVLTAPETRSSSPVRILRDENRCSSVNGLYPCGEGAGYAGGIMSAAVDGIMCAEAIINKYLPNTRDKK